MEQFLIVHACSLDFIIMSDDLATAEQFLVRANTYNIIVNVDSITTGVVS